LSLGGQLTVAPRATNGLIADATVELSSPAPIYLEYGNERAGWLRTPTSAPATLHQQPLLRLRPETEYRVFAYAVQDEGRAVQIARASFTSSRLPEQLPKLTATATGRSNFPLMLMDVRLASARTFEDDRRWFVA